LALLHLSATTPKSNGLWMLKVSLPIHKHMHHPINVIMGSYGIDHYNAVAEAILSARTEIYICDWWLSPELVRSTFFPHLIIESSI
jgi:hypothetical protein